VKAYPHHDPVAATSDANGTLERIGDLLPRSILLSRRRFFE